MTAGLDVGHELCSRHDARASLFRKLASHRTFLNNALSHEAPRIRELVLTERADDGFLLTCVADDVTSFAEINWWQGNLLSRNK
jgi:hypothetical protein